MTAIEKAYEIMKSSFNGGLGPVKGSGGEGGETRDSLAKLISMMESIVQKTNTTAATPASAAKNMVSPNTKRNINATVSKDVLAGEARRISTAYTEEQTKLDLMMKIQQTRQRQALQRRLWERNQAHHNQQQQQADQQKQQQLFHQRTPYHDGDEIEELEDDDEDEHEENEAGNGIQIRPGKSLVLNSRPSFHQDSIRGNFTVPKIAESRDQQRNMALRGLNLGPLQRK
jgi:hypothetical protein